MSAASNFPEVALAIAWVNLTTFRTFLYLFGGRSALASERFSKSAEGMVMVSG